MKTLKTILAACLLLMGLTAMAQPSILPLRLKADGKLYLPEEKLWPDQKPYGEASSVPGWLEILSGKECYRVVLYADADAPLYAAFELMELIRHEGLDFVLVCNSAEEGNPGFLSGASAYRFIDDEPVEFPVCPFNELEQKPAFRGTVIETAADLAQVAIGGETKRINNKVHGRIQFDMTLMPDGKIILGTIHFSTLPVNEEALKAAVIAHNQTVNEYPYYNQIWSQPAMAKGEVCGIELSHTQIIFR